MTFAVTATGDNVARLAQGYRLDAGYTLTFEIVSANMVLGTGKVVALKGNFVSASANNRGASFSSENQGKSLVLKSTASANNRARSIVAKFDVPVDASKLAAPIVVPVSDKHAPSRSGGRRTAKAPKATTSTTPAKPPKAVAPLEIKTDSLLLPRLFCDHMVLQQQTTNTFWGRAKPGEMVAVKASWGAEASAKADADGKWKLFLETPKHGTGHSLIVRGDKDVINIKNVAIGEVWLCAGQSNMGWSMGNSFEAEKEADVNLPDFRIFKSAREHWHIPLEMQRDRLSQWKLALGGRRDQRQHGRRFITGSFQARRRALCVGHESVRAQPAL